MLGEWWEGDAGCVVLRVVDRIYQENQRQGSPLSAIKYPKGLV